jgi:hypothetical protein
MAAAIMLLILMEIGAIGNFTKPCKLQRPDSRAPALKNID